MSSLYLFLLCCLSAWLMYLWFYSDFFAFYAKVLKVFFPKKVYEWLLIDEYFSNPEQNLSYIHFLYTSRIFSTSFTCHFFLKLFSCTICLTTWFSGLLTFSLNVPFLVSSFHPA